MNYTALQSKSASVGGSVLAISSTLFNFDSTNLSRAQHALIMPTSAGLKISWDGVAPTSVAATGGVTGVPVTSGLTYELFGNVNINRLQMIASPTTSAAVYVILEG
jgi:hypothetical protein